MEIMFGTGALVLFAAIIYATRQSARRRKERGIDLPEEKAAREP